MRVLEEREWLAQQHRHEVRFDNLLGTYLQRRASGRHHPVVDFLFTYYNFKPAHLRRWHPGAGIALAGTMSSEFEDRRGYRRSLAGVCVDPSFIAHRCDFAEYVARMMRAIDGRQMHLGCFGLHEWAMVYGSKQPRHAVPLRLGAAGTDSVVDSMQIRCTHYDAFRFFTPEALPHNENKLSRDGQIEYEQPGCLHAAMDLYRYASKLMPILSSEFLWSTFELAYGARELDMRASPYDLTEYGYEPIAIETPAGRAEYVRQQSVTARRATELRRVLLEKCESMLVLSAT